MHLRERPARGVPVRLFVSAGLGLRGSEGCVPVRPFCVRPLARGDAVAAEGGGKSSRVYVAELRVALADGIGKGTASICQVLPRARPLPAKGTGFGREMPNAMELLVRPQASYENQP